MGPCAAAAACCCLLLGQLVSVGLLPGLDYIWHHGVNQRQRLNGPSIKQSPILRRKEEISYPNFPYVNNEVSIVIIIVSSQNKKNCGHAKGGTSSCQPKRNFS